MSVEEILIERKKRKEREEASMKESYKDHVAKHVIYEAGENKVEKLIWKKPGTINYAVCYMISGGYLFAYGDLGEAVYQWSDFIDFEFLAGLNVDYFAGKCQASEYERGYKDWCEIEAKEDVDELINSAAEYKECICVEDAEDDEECKCFEKYKKDLWEKFRETGGDGSLYSKDEWYEWCRESAYKVFGEDWGEWIGNTGEIVAHRCRLHLLGIKMAVEQLKVNKDKVE